MLQWDIGQRRMGDDPPFLTVGTEVSAKYKGAFCEAKVRKVVRSVKCKVTFKLGLGTISITDDQIKGGTLRVGSVCEVKHPEKKEFLEAIINKIQDCSQYTVDFYCHKTFKCVLHGEGTTTLCPEQTRDHPGIRLKQLEETGKPVRMTVFDDGDITTLRRTALCLKSGRHFAESETLDQLPLTHPEHFSNPVIGGRKGRRSRQTQEDTSDEDDSPKKGKKKEEKEADIGKVVCVELGDKKKQKDNWFPGLVVAPTAQDTVRIRVKDEYLVRSFKDGRYFTVPKKEATEFTREIGNKVDNNTLKGAVEKALQYLDRDELPPHWDRDLLFGLDESSVNSDTDGAFDSDSSDDEPREEKDHFVAQLYKFMDDRGTPINQGPTIGSRDVDLYKLFKVVHKLGGYNRVTNHNQWKTISQKLGFGQGNSSTTNLVKQSYKKFLHSFEDFYRKLGCTMVNHPRGHRSRHRTGRSLIRDRDRATPTIVSKDKEKKEEKPVQGAEKLENKQPDASGKDPVLPEKKEKEEQKPHEEEKKEESKVKEATKKSKAREEKSEVQNKQKVKENAESPLVAIEDKDSRPKSKKESKPSEVKVSKVPENVVKEETDPVASEIHEENVNEEVKSRDSKNKIKESKLKEKAKSSSEKSKLKEEKPKVLEENEEANDNDGEEGDESEINRKKMEKKATVEDDKHMRTKSKDGSKNKKDMGSSRDQRETRTPSRDSVNKTPTRGSIPKEDEGSGSSQKKRGRKRKEMDEKAKLDESMGRLASHVTVCVGDKLKVYYGPTHESKVTYEAKVLEIEEDGSECMYLVHYTGWNTRYDEWIKRGRIADNLSWTPSRAKRQRHQQSQHKISRQTLGKRGRPSVSGRSQECAPNPPRSTTPSSITSSSSRTKSPATRTTPRMMRSAGDGTSPSHEFRRRTRRMSGHTDVSMASDTESEEFESDVEPQNEMAQTRSRTSEQRRSASALANTSGASISTPSAGSDKDEHPPSCQAPKEELIRKSGIKKKGSTGSKKKDAVTEITNVLTVEDDDDNLKFVKASESPPCAEKRRSRRAKQTPPLNSRSRTTIDIKAEINTGTESEDDSSQPKGRDFDLNQIRSELKGIEKAVKSPQDLSSAPLSGEVADDEDDDDEEEERKIDVKKEPRIKGEVKQETKMDIKGVSTVPTIFEDLDVEEDEDFKDKSKEQLSDVCLNLKSTSPAQTTASTMLIEEEEDVYEFKEPEPFEFEVRKRELLLPDSKGLARRSGISTLRLFELPISSPESSPPSLLPHSTSITPVTSSPTRFSDLKSPRKRLTRTPPKDPLILESCKKIRRTPQKKLIVEDIKSTSNARQGLLDCDPSQTEIHLHIPEQVTSSSRVTTMELTFEKIGSENLFPTSSITTSFTQIGKSNVRSSASPVHVSNAEDRLGSPPLLSLQDHGDDGSADNDDDRKSELGPLSIFTQGQDDDGDDDHEDRLVISESDDMVTEIAEPLFSYQQRDHEDLFPTHVTSKAVVTANEESDSCKAEEPPCLSPVVPSTSIFGHLSSPVGEVFDSVKRTNVNTYTSNDAQVQLQSQKTHINQQTQVQQPPQLHQQKPHQVQIEDVEITQVLKQHSECSHPNQRPGLFKQQLDYKQTVNQTEKLQSAKCHEQLSNQQQTELPHQIDVPLSKQLQEQGQLMKQPTMIPKQEQIQFLKNHKEHSESPNYHDSFLQQKLQHEKSLFLKLQKEPSVLTKTEEKLSSQGQEPPQASQTKILPSLTSTIQREENVSPESPHTSENSGHLEAFSQDDSVKCVLENQEDVDESQNTLTMRSLMCADDKEDSSVCGAEHRKGVSTLSENKDLPKTLPPSSVVAESLATPNVTRSSFLGTAVPEKKSLTQATLNSSFLDSEDSSVDSSDDEDQRLVIDPMEDGCSQIQSCNSPPASTELKLQVVDAAIEVLETDSQSNKLSEISVVELRGKGTIVQTAAVISSNLSPAHLQDETSSVGEVLTRPTVSEDGMAAENVQIDNPIEEGPEDNAQDQESLDESSNQITLHAVEPITEEAEESNASLVTPVVVKVDLDDATKIPEADIISDGVVVLDASSDLSSGNSDVHTLTTDTHSSTTTTTVVTATIVASSSSSLQSPNTNLICETTASADTSPILALAAVPLSEGEAAEMRQEQRNDDADSQLLGSLLCQETIPGSPAQAGESVSEDPLPESKVLVLEMPFASVPASSCEVSNSAVSLPVPISVPLSIPIETNISTIATTPTPATAPIVETEVLPSVPETSSSTEIVSEDMAVAVNTPPAQQNNAVPSPGVSKLNSNEAAPVIENTPPTTPDSSLSTMSGSPREEPGDMSPAMDNESSKSHRDSFDLDLDSCLEGTKVGHFSEDDSLLNIEVSNPCDNRLQELKLDSKKNVLELDKDRQISPKKRRRSRKRSECESNKRVRCSSGRSVRHIGGTGSDSDTSENSALGCTPMTSSESTLSSKSPRPSKYNFYVELDPELDGSQRIALLQQKLQELRKTYMNVKAELACIDRRRKKLRRREREVEKATKQEVACS